MSTFSIGQLSKLTNCKIPTIRYYEDIALLSPAFRSEGNQRRSKREHLVRLKFIRHSRDLGFNLKEIKQLIHLQTCANHSPHEAHGIAQHHLAQVQEKITKLQSLARELSVVINSCQQGDAIRCQVLDAL